MDEKSSEKLVKISLERVLKYIFRYIADLSISFIVIEVAFMIIMLSFGTTAEETVIKIFTFFVNNKLVNNHTSLVGTHIVNIIAFWNLLVSIVFEFLRWITKTKLTIKPLVWFSLISGLLAIIHIAVVIKLPILWFVMIISYTVTIGDLVWYWLLTKLEKKLFKDIDNLNHSSSSGTIVSQ